MRPLELTVTGLRSYRTTTPVTFPEDWRLAAVVGPTGAGKSSLLEAIVYALFGSGTVPGASQPTNLITDDSREMRVVFRFAVGRERFEIARTYRRVGNVPPVLKSNARTYSGVKEVDDAVTRLLGLRQEAFCSTVLLPQGQFATLLQAGGNVQKDTLDAFFRLGEVTELSGRLVGAAATLASQRREVEAVRSQLPADPAAETRQAERRLRQAEQRRDAADKLAEVVALHEKNASAAAARAEAARRRADDLVKAADALDKVAGRAGRLEALAIEITSAEEALLERTDVASAAVSAARENLGLLDAPGVEMTAARVDTLLDRIGEAAAAKDQATTAAADAEQAQGDLELTRAEHGRLAEQLERVRAEHERSHALEAKARERLDNLRDLAEDATRSAVAARNAEARRVAALEDLELAEAAELLARQQLTEAVAKLTTAENAATMAQRILADAEIEAATATGQAERLGQLRRDTDERRADRDRLVGLAATSRVRLEQARTLLDEATRAEIEAEVRWREAQVALHDARREDAAATAAAGCGPGDPCPVCAHELPPGFVPPAPATTTTGAELIEKTAHLELTSCRRVTARAEAELDACAREEADVATQLDAAQAQLSDAELVLSAEGGADWAHVTAAADAAREFHENARRADRASSEILTGARANLAATERSVQPLTAATQRAMAALVTATTGRDETADHSDRSRRAFAEAGGDDALATARTDLATATETLSTSKGRLDSAERSAANAKDRLGTAEQLAAARRASADSAATQNRRAAEAVVNAMTMVGAQAGLSAAGDAVVVAEAARLWVTQRRALIAEAKGRFVEAETALGRIRGEAAELQARRVAELQNPLADATNAGVRLAAVAELPSPLTTPGPAGLAAWATAATAETRNRAGDQQRDAHSAGAEVAAARVAARTACEDAGVDRDRLDGWHREMHQEVGAAREALREATRVAERARTLDAVLASTADRFRLLGLARELCQGKDSFANHVLVARRQGLIAESAAILTELSSGRLTFAEDIAATFSVLDTATEAVRDPRLLSGGEQFQASLALALGLVEIAARAGSQIECLFLDEGFGALDPASLDTALDALESAARRGRRIVAVTHVDAVTARADRVLGVTGSEAGSHAAWRGAEFGAVV